MSPRRKGDHDEPSGESEETETPDGSTPGRRDSARVGLTPSEEKALLKEAIAKLDAAILGRIDLDRDEYEIGTSVGRRRLKHIPMGDMIRLREIYQGELKRLSQEEKLQNGLGTGRKIHVRLP